MASSNPPTGLVPARKESAGRSFAASNRLNAGPDVISSFEMSTRHLKILIMSQQDYLPGEIVQDFVLLLETEESHLKQANKELENIPDGTDWNDVNRETSEVGFLIKPQPARIQKFRFGGIDKESNYFLTDATSSSLFPNKSVTPSIRGRSFTATALLEQRQLLTTTSESLTREKEISPFTPISRPHSCSLSTTLCSLSKAKNTPSRLARPAIRKFESSYKPEVDEVIELSAQEQTLSNFQTRTPSPPKPRRTTFSTPIVKAKESFNYLVKEFQDLSKSHGSFSNSLRTNLESQSQPRRFPLPQTPIQTRTPPPTAKPKPDLTTSHSYLSKTTYSENPLNSTWIMDDTWLSISSDASCLLATPESLFQDAHYQAGLIAIDIALSTPTSTDPEPCTPPSTSPSSQKSFSSLKSSGSSPNSTPASSPPSTQGRRSVLSAGPVLHGHSTDSSTVAKAELINLHLLRSCALLASAQPRRALHAADIALNFANAHEICYMISKSQLYRGLCLMKLERWAEATLAFARAANVRGWAVRVKELKSECERHVSADGEIGASPVGKERIEIAEKDILYGVWPQGSAVDENGRFKQ